MLLYAKLKGIKIYPYTYEPTTAGDKFTPYLLEEDDDKDDYNKKGYLLYFKKPLGKKSTFKQIEFSKTRMLTFDFVRNDPILVQVVEQLKDEVNTTYSFLEVIEIPDDIKWYIYVSDDGTECVHEEHRVWC